MDKLFENWNKFIKEQIDEFPEQTQDKASVREFVFSEGELKRVNASIAKIVSEAKRVFGAEGEIPQLDSSMYSQQSYNSDVRMVAEIEQYMIDVDDATEDEIEQAELLGVSISQLRSMASDVIPLRKKYYGSDGEIKTKGPRSRKDLEKSLGQMTPQDFEEAEIVIPVPQEVLDSLAQMVEDTKEVEGLYEEARDWYHNIRGLLDTETGNDKDATLLGLMIAVYSPRAKFALNLAEAVFMYKAVKQDVDEGKSERLMEYLQTFPDAKNRQPGEFRGFTGAHKVPNFTLNLIAPDLAGERDESGIVEYDDMYEWNSTIDTWMIDAFYPSLRRASTSKEWAGLKGKMMGDVVAYRYMARLVAQEARKLNLLPHELQALIWVSSQIKQTGETGLGVTTQFAFNQIREAITNVAEIKQDLRTMVQLNNEDWLATILTTIDEQGFEEAGRYVKEPKKGVRSITSRGKKGDMFPYIPPAPPKPKIAKDTSGTKPSAPKQKAVNLYAGEEYNDLATWYVMNNIIQMPTGKFNNLHDAILLYLSPDFSKEKAVEYITGRFDPEAKSTKLYFKESKNNILVKMVMEELTKSDKSEIKKMISKEVESILKSKSTKDIIADELEKHMSSKATKEEIGEIAKSILKKLYKDLSLQHPYIIDRIKI